MLNPSQTYHRKKQILYDESGNQILKFKENAADVENLTGDLVENMNRFIKLYPERVEIIIKEEKQNNVQLNLF